MFRSTTIIFLFSVFFLVGFLPLIQTQNHQILPIGQTAVTAYSSSKGDTTYYLFYFSLPNLIKSDAFIHIEFPQEFQSGLISTGSPECGYMNPAYIAVPCIINDRRFELSMGSLQTGTYQIIVGEVLNPTSYGTSSNFKVYTYQSQGLIDYNENLGNIAFSDPPSKFFLLYFSLNFRFFFYKGDLLYAGVYIYGAAPKIGYGTPYKFHFTLNKAVGSGNSIRVTYPKGYTSKTPSCEVDGVVGPASKTLLLHNKRVFVCEKIAKNLLNEAFVMTQVRSPSFSGMQRGFKIEILQGNSPVVLHRLSFNGDIYIAPGTPAFTITPSVLFKSSYATYKFKIFLANRVDSNGALFLNFTSDWNLNSSNCSIREGGTPLQGSKYSDFILNLCK